MLVCTHHFNYNNFIFRVVTQPVTVLAGLSTLPNVVRGKVLAGDPVIVTALTRLPQGIAQIRLR